jgi:hypothetical protein
MKRFVMLTVMLVATFAATRNAQAQGKDLAGTWVLDVEKSGHVGRTETGGDDAVHE